MKGGGIINLLLYFFFLSFIINFLVSIYSLYLFLEIKIFNHGQGAKLNLKKQSLLSKEE